MRVHHIALLTPDPARLAAFYGDVLGLRETRRQADEAGLRSVWLDAGGTVLMVERGGARGAAPGGWTAVMFAARPGSRGEWEARLGASRDGGTAYTLYGRDPDGNRFGVSSYPDPL